jgi:cytidylate kinase
MSMPEDAPLRSFVIAVDGPAASGKGTIATGLGAAFGLPVLDTGLLYRCVGVLMQKAGGNLDDQEAAAAAAALLTADQLDDPALRTRAAGEAASRVAVHSRVRDALLEFQRTFARQDGGAVLDGRDIGTVIAPDAPAKLFVTASPEVRAHRRWSQLKAQGEDVGLDDVLADIRRRDARDGGRDAAPMTRAPDAVLLDTTEMTIEQAADAARRIVEAARARWKPPK